MQTGLSEKLQMQDFISFKKSREKNVYTVGPDSLA